MQLEISHRVMTLHVKPLVDVRIPPIGRFCNVMSFVLDLSNFVYLADSINR